MHKFPKEEALIWATIFAVVLIAVGSTYACSGPTYVLQSIAGHHEDRTPTHGYEPTRAMTQL
jgi:hypothetical protein